MRTGKSRLYVIAQHWPDHDAKQNSATAIVKGAVTASLYGLGTASVAPDGAFNFMSTRRVGVVSRKAGRHYGTWGYDDCNDNDPIGKRYGALDDRVAVSHEANMMGREMRDDGAKVARMHWFAKMVRTIPSPRLCRDSRMLTR